MIAQGVLEEVQTSPSFVSTMFLRPKPDGSMRPIFNLKNLNFYVGTDKFRMINIQRVPDFVQINDWAAKIDIHQAYFHVPVSKSHRRFLRLQYNLKNEAQPQIFQMTCLPFGLNSAPRTFASITNWIAQRLREQGVRLLVYLDDFYLVHQNQKKLAEHIALTMTTLNMLGWQINHEKSVLEPQKCLEFLGIVWDHAKNIKYLPERLVIKVRVLATSMIAEAKTTLKNLQSIIGILNFASFVVPRGRLNYRYLQRLANLALKTKPPVFLNADVRRELKWWIDHCKDTSPIHFPPPAHYLATDASDLGWGAKLDNKTISGSWRNHQQNLHCNQKEMLAIMFVLKDHAQLLSSKTLMIQCDNKTVVSYLRNEGGTKSTALMNLTIQVFQIIEAHNIHMLIYHIPGTYNCEADHLSRHKLPPEWHLLPNITNIVFKKWGTPSIDLFASGRAHVVPAYCTLDRNDEQASMYDALANHWNFDLAWVFPPPFMIPRVLHHLNTARGVYLLVVPRWEQVYWSPDLKNRALSAPFTIKDPQQALVDLTTGLPPPQSSQMTLEIWKCAGGMSS